MRPYMAPVGAVGDVSPHPCRGALYAPALRSPLSESREGSGGEDRCYPCATTWVPQAAQKRAAGPSGLPQLPQKLPALVA